jgi:hypothetical protein
MTKMLCAAVVAAGLVVLPLLAPAQGQGQGPTSLEELVSSMADTAEEHKAVADYFRSKAKSARGEEESHRRMGRGYSSGKPPEIQKMKEHCDRIAESQASIAKEYEELARLHDDVAKGKAAKPAKP